MLSYIAMKILISGSSGLIGSVLVKSLTHQGHEIYRLVRSQSDEGPNAIYWNPLHKEINSKYLEGFDTIIHLAGENIAGRRWTEKRKQLIRDSRVLGTRFLCQQLTALKKPPQTLLCASATGYYGDRGDQILDESSTVGAGFLASLCEEWERATEPTEKKGIRVVHLRFGVILSPKGGALKSMLLPFRLGLGGVVGDGQQYMSWIALDDVVSAISHIMKQEDLKGPINLTTPNPVTNETFTKTLGKILKRPTLLPFPAGIARLALGEMAQELLLTSTRVLPKKLYASGYQFQFSNLEKTLKALLS